MVPKLLKHLVIDSLHQTHPGQLGMLRLADLIWFPCIRRDVTYKAQSSPDCIKNGKNLKAIQTKSQLVTLLKLNEPNEEKQTDFAGPLTFREQTDDYYLLVTVDRLTGYLHAQVYKNCDTETALKYLEEYCNFHGIPRSIRCDQAQAFIAREFELYCTDKNIKPMLAPAGDHRATGMVERLIQTIKRRIAIMQSDPLWSIADLAQIVTKIIQSIRPIPNSVTKKKPFEAHFGRPPNTELSNIIIKASKTRLTYNKIRYFVSDKAKLKQPLLSREAVWALDSDSEPEIDIRYKDEEPPQSAVPRALSLDTSDSENAPLLSHTRVSGRFTPSKLQITFGDKTSTIIYNKKNVARKTIAR